MKINPDANPATWRAGSLGNLDQGARDQLAWGKFSRNPSA
jgi:hypothetical protein